MTSLGQKGLQGFQGQQGVIGTQGNIGMLGFQGLWGNQGGAGGNGVQGREGLQGIQGFDGTNGVQGNQGFEGFGNTGNTGFFTMTPFGATAGEITNIPSGWRYINVSFRSIGLTGGIEQSGLNLQVGDATAYNTSGYTGCTHYVTSGNIVPALSFLHSTQYVITNNAVNNDYTFPVNFQMVSMNGGKVVNIISNTYTSLTTNRMYFGVGYTALAGEMTRFRILPAPARFFREVDIRVWYL